MGDAGPAEARHDVREFAVVAVLFVGVIAALSLAYPSPTRSTVVVSLLAAGTLLVWRDRTDITLGATAAACGPAAEYAATASGLWAYTAPSIGGLPLWVVPMWWIYAVTVPRLVRATLGSRPRPVDARLPAALMIVGVAWLCRFGVTQPWFALAGVGVLLALFLRRHHARADLAMLVVCGAIGPAAELIPVWMGAWSYPGTPTALPVWLPAGYGLFGTSLIYFGLGLAQAGNPLGELHHAETEDRVAGG